MKLVTAVVNPSTIAQIKVALKHIDVHGLTISDVRGYGVQKGHTEVYRGTEHAVECVPKTKVEVLTQDGKVEEIVEAIISAARTGKIGDGKVWVSSVEKVIRVRTGEKDQDALI